MPHPLVKKDQRKTRTHRKHDLKCQQTFQQKGILNESLQRNLPIFFHEMGRQITQLEKLRARVLSDDFFTLNAEFEQKLDEARETYQGIFKKTFDELVKEAKEIDNIAGVGGFVLGFIDSAIETIKQSNKVHKAFSKFLEEREDEVKAENLKALREYREEADKIRSRISDAWRDTLYHVQSLSLDLNQRKQANEIINHEKELANILLDTLGRNLDELENHIQFDEIGPIKFVDNSLPHQLMTDFLINAKKGGPRSSIIFSRKTGLNIRKQFTTWLSHLWRDANIRKHFFLDIPNTVNLAAAQNILSSDPEIKNYQLSCLGAVLKRFPVVDYQAERFDYYIMKSQIKRVAHLIQQAELTIEEDLELVSPLVLCTVDWFAHWQLRLTEQVPSALRNSFFHSSPFGADRHESIRRVLDVHIREMIKQRKLWEQDPNNTDAEQKMLYRADIIHNIVKQIVDFYGEHLITAFWDSPLIKKAIEKEAGVPGRQEAFIERVRGLIDAEVVKLINNELLDATPSPYYAAPLCALSQVLTGLNGEGNITIRINQNRHFEILYSGESLKPLERKNPTARQQSTYNLHRQTPRASHAQAPNRYQSAQSLNAPYPSRNHFQPAPSQQRIQPARITPAQKQPTPYNPSNHSANSTQFFKPHPSAQPRQTFTVRETIQTPQQSFPIQTNHAYGKPPSRAYINAHQPRQQTYADDWEFSC